jgi:lauroyl/myristoyl acyltransferase
MRFHEPIRPEHFVTAPDPVRAMTERMNQHLETWIRDHPEDWMCRRKRWAKRHPPASARDAGSREGGESSERILP